MRTFKILIIGFFLCFLYSETTPYTKNKLIVKFDYSLNKTNIEVLLENTDFNLNRKLVRRLNIWEVSISGHKFLNEDQGLNTIRMLPEVVYAQLDHLVSSRVIPNDPDFNQMWDMNNTGQGGGTNDADIDAPEAWDITTGGLTALGDEIVVAVVDGGVQISHTDLVANIWVNENEIPGNGIDDDNNGYIDDINGWDAYSDDGSIPSDSHGTHVAGTVGAVGNNGNDVVGVNWNVKIMSVAGSTGSTATISIAYGYVLDQKSLWLETNGQFGANVVATNSSFGVDYADCNSGSYPVWNDLYNAMGEVGILSAAATINANQNVDSIGDVPTGCDSDYIIAVTNTTNNDVKYNGAGYGATTIDLGAPGTNICSTVPTNSVSCSYTGTSMATPHVAGAVGLLHSVPNLNLAQLCIDDPGACALFLKQTLLDNTDPLTSLNGVTVSGGRLNIFNAVAAISGPAPQLSYSPSSIEFFLGQGQEEYELLTISNTGEVDSQLNYSIDSSPFQNVGGGPDIANNYWADSDDNENINYDWIDISEMGTLYSFSHNDQAGTSINIGFNFPFYDEIYNQCIINANGWIGFGSDNNEWDNINIPSAVAPQLAIFGFWDDLNPVNDNCNEYCAGVVYTHSNAERLVVWFNNVAHWWTDYENSFYDFQMVLYSTGEVRLNYNSIVGEQSATIGMQNGSGNSALQVSTPAHNQFSVNIIGGPEWLSVSPNSGEIQEGQNTISTVTANSTGLSGGDYSAFLTISSQGGNGTIPVSLNVSNQDLVMGDLNQDAAVNILDIVIEVNIILGVIEPTTYQLWVGDLNSDGAINVLDIILIINTILDTV